MPKSLSNESSPSSQNGNVVLEEELKNKVSRTYFPAYDTTAIVGKIDFAVAKSKKALKGQPFLFDEDRQDVQFFLWAEAKRGTNHNIIKSLVQLILTIGKAKTFETYLPPLFLGAMDAEKIAFIPYAEVSHLFYKNDFNWNVTPSNHNTKEFKEIMGLIRPQLENNALLFYYGQDDRELKEFISLNFVLGNAEHSRIQVSKSNFTTVYLKWLEKVKPSINIHWEAVKELGILDADFFLADLMSQDNISLKESLLVLLKSNFYMIVKETQDELGLTSVLQANFKDGQIAHRQFWSKYQRPPRKDFWQYIVERRDLLVPQDVRERKGSFFTPQIWVEKSQEYLTRVLGVNWQDEYVIWDCCAGTGNMERGLINRYNVYASTLDKADVDVIHDQIQNGMKLLDSHVFQFDFLNDSLDSSKIPQKLREVISNPERRKHLIIYINPPYAEATNSRTIVSNKNKHKKGVSRNRTYELYHDKLGRAVNEVFAQFLMRIYVELNGCWIGQFSKLKHLQSENFNLFRKNFQARLDSSFIVPADTFDNVTGKFPIGFFIWNTTEKQGFQSTNSHVYNREGHLVGMKKIYRLPDKGVIMKWIQRFYDKQGNRIAYMVRGAADFQNNRIVFITLAPSESVIRYSRTHDITANNIIENGVYFAVRHCIAVNWLNDRDQFLSPETESWANDKIFQSDCLIFTLFHDQNVIKSQDGVNHWIPFREKVVDARELYDSHIVLEQLERMTFSDTSRQVMEAAQVLYRHYHAKPDSNPNASFYDIREYFQGRDKRGRLNAKSSDSTYTRLLKVLRTKHAELGRQIARKVYEHGFLPK